MAKKQIEECPACQEMKACGLSFEETHSSRKKGFLETEDGFIPSPHETIRLNAGQKVGKKRWLVKVEGSKAKPRLRVVDFKPTKAEIKEWHASGFIPGLLLSHKESCELVDALKGELVDALKKESDHCVICGRAFPLSKLEEVPNHQEFIGDETGCLVCLNCK